MKFIRKNGRVIPIRDDSAGNRRQKALGGVGAASLGLSAGAYMASKQSMKDFKAYSGAAQRLAQSSLVMKHSPADAAALRKSSIQHGAAALKSFSVGSKFARISKIGAVVGVTAALGSLIKVYKFPKKSGQPIKRVW